MPKVIARNMILMVRDINGHFADGPQHVTCYTCHRGHKAGNRTVVDVRQCAYDRYRFDRVTGQL
jgi:hypothetical protein